MKNPGRGIILMTAMPPTIGHGFLINFGARYCTSSGLRELHIIVGTQPSEPMSDERYAAIKKYCYNVPMVGYLLTHHFHQEVQQEPLSPEDTNFWSMWCSHLRDIVGEINPGDVIISSETYGAELAKHLGCRSIICDPKREAIFISGTDVRNDPINWSEKILPEFLPYVQKRVTIYGAESTGKTTVAHNVSGNIRLPEYARPYLESLPSQEVTEARMGNIVYGQYALMESARKSPGAFLIVQDTDLLSTIGYYRIYNKNYETLRGYQRALELFRLTNSDLYIMLESNIPFTPDPLRYGGDKREGTDEFWEGLLKEFDCNYVIVGEADWNYRIDKADDHIYELLKSNPLWGFKRK